MQIRFKCAIVNIAQVRISAKFTLGRSREQELGELLKDSPLIFSVLANGRGAHVAIRRV